MKPRHTWHPNTFGLLYGKTTKTACGKRIVSRLIVKARDITCEECFTALVEEAYAYNDMFAAATGIAQSRGYASLAEWLKANPTGLKP